MQALSNGNYKSVWHRAVVNAGMARLSIASFITASDSAVIQAPEVLTGWDEGKKYRDFTYGEYYKTFWSRDLDQKHGLDFFKN